MPAVLTDDKDVGTILLMINMLIPLPAIRKAHYASFDIEGISYNDVEKLTKLLKNKDWASDKKADWYSGSDGKQHKTFWRYSNEDEIKLTINGLHELYNEDQTISIRVKIYSFKTHSLLKSIKKELGLTFSEASEKTYKEAF